MKRIYIILILAIICTGLKAQTAYITNEGDNTVSVINIGTNIVTAIINVGFEPFGVSVSSDGNKVYITNSGDSTVSVINTYTNTVMATIKVGTNPVGVSVSPDGSKLFVANDSSNTVSVINTANNTVTSTIPVGAGPYGISVNPNGNDVYVANAGSNSVSVISTATNTVTATITVGKNPEAFGNFISTHVTGIAPQSMLTANIAVYPNPAMDNLFIESPSATIEIINMQGQLIKVFTTTTNKTSINVSAFPFGVYIVKAKTKSGTAFTKFVKE
jgi:YVTN family beta-propeller protein